MVLSKEDWSAAMSSEVFKEYLKISLAEEQNIKISSSKENEEQKYLEEFKILQAKIKTDPRMKKQFKILQHKFSTDPVYRKKTNQQFVESVMLLDLGE